MEPSELYEEYKIQFIHNCDLLQVLSFKEDPNQYQKLIHDNTLLLKHIAIQLCSLGSKASAVQQSKIQPFKKKFIQWKKDWESESSNILKQSTEQVEDAADQNQKLFECKKLLGQLEDTSLNISENLQSQTSKLKQTKEKLSLVDKVIDRANTLVNKMTLRENRRRNVLYFVLVVVILILGGFKVYWY